MGPSPGGGCGVDGEVLRPFEPPAHSQVLSGLRTNTPPPTLMSFRVSVFFPSKWFHGLLLQAKASRKATSSKLHLITYMSSHVSSGLENRHSVLPPLLVPREHLVEVEAI